MARSEWSSAQLDSSPGRLLILATRRGGTRTLFAATAAGAVVVFVFLTAILPAPAGTPAHNAILFNLAIFVAYMLLARSVAEPIRSARAGLARTSSSRRATSAAPHRLEYTVIGDPVNEAARLTELAKDEALHVLASEAALTAAGDGEAAHWRLGDAVQLRGRAETTRLARPAAGME